MVGGHAQASGLGRHKGALGGLPQFEYSPCVFVCGQHGSSK